MRLRLEHALLESGVQPDVLVEVEDGWITVGTIRSPAGDVDVVPGLTLPGLANCHSHAFHRALRGRTQTERGSFWTWREQMYAVAAELDAGHLLRARPRHLRRDARDRHQRGRRVPLPAPPARRDAVRRPQRDGQGAAGGGRRGGDPDPPARHLLPRRGHRPTTRGRAGAVLRRRRRRVGGTSGCVRRPAGRRCDPLGACGPARPAEGGRRGCPGRAAARARLRAGRRERGLPRGVRPHSHAAARRGRRARAADDRRARHPPDRGRRRAARGVEHQCLLLPDHRARPRRRDRSGAAAARRRRHADPGFRQPRGDRPVRGDARGGDARAAGFAAPRSLVALRSCSRPRRTTDTGRSASTTPAGSRRASGPTSSRSTSSTHPHPRAPAHTAETIVFAATAADATTDREAE